MFDEIQLDKRFLEDSFPIKEVSSESAREKAIRQGHISTMHLWWARRPLVASRAINYAALVFAKRLQEKSVVTNFLIDLAKWKNSNSPNILTKARKDILEANNYLPPRILDPFAGGGSIPLESLRLGCETFANDYNPVAILLLKSALEYPQVFSKNDCTISNKTSLSCEIENRLHKQVNRVGLSILDEARKELSKFYPNDEDGSIPIAFIWSRTIKCNNSSCNAEIPLIKQYWLSKTKNKKISLHPIVSGKEVSFEIVGDGYNAMPMNFDPNKGTISKAVAVCPVCGSATDADTIKILIRGSEKRKLIAVVTKKPDIPGRYYRIATQKDQDTVDDAEKYLKSKQDFLMKKWGIDPVPDEIIFTPNGKEYEKGGALYNFTPVLLYGMTKWRDLFNPRQKLALIKLAEATRDSYDEMIAQGFSAEEAKIIATYLGLVLDGVADHNSMCCRWRAQRVDVSNTFGRQALPMIWDHAEVNVIGGSTGSFIKTLERVLKVIDHISKLPAKPGIVSKSSASGLSYPNNYFDAVITDPPYYDNVPYSVISDFFYVWLKRSIGHLYPELFATPLTPKTDEIIDDLSLLRGIPKEKAKSLKGISVKDKTDFEGMLTKAFREVDRVLKPNGIAVIVYAHKSTAGWETLINSLLDSGLVITAAWPIHTEMGGRLRAMESAALGSSIYIVARKLTKAKIGVYKDVKEELQAFLNKKMDLLWEEGVSGADFLISAIGASIVVFGKYEQVLRENMAIRADVMLEDVRRIVTDYAVKQVLHNGFAAEISNLTRFYLLWRWSYGESILPYDDARKLSQSTQIDLSHEWSKIDGVIRKKKENVCLLGPQDRNLEELEGLEKKDLIDVLHMALLLWQKGDREAIVDLLSESGFGSKDSFYRVAQAISETLPKESQEKKLIEGFLAGKERLSSETKKINIQKRLFE